MSRVTKRACIAALCVLGAAVDGITKAYDIDDLPASVNTAALPAILHLDSGTDSGDLSAQRGAKFETHHVRVLILVDPIGQGRLEDHMGTALDLYDAYFEAIMTNPNRSTVNWYDCTIIKTEPIGVISFGGTDYCALEMTTDITVYSS